MKFMGNIPNFGWGIREQVPVSAFASTFLHNNGKICLKSVAGKGADSVTTCA